MARPLVFFLICTFLVSSLTPIPVQAGVETIHELSLPKPGTMVHLSSSFTPAMLKGIKVFPKNPFQFEFILDKGDGYADSEMVKAESKKLVKYFMASLTTPENDLWVNLSPYEKQRIVPESFGQTDMGRDLLAQDYLLKQITASLMYPEDEAGKKFWKRVYEEAAKKFGTTNIPVNTFNKVWIVPAKAVVYENAKVGMAYVVESKLKVMLEQDYLAESKLSARGGSASGGKVMMEEDYLSLSKNTVGVGSKPTLNRAGYEPAPTNNINQLGSKIIREIIIPQLEREVNSNKNFAQLRQVYNSLILATWYKNKIKDSILAKEYVDKKKVEGIKYNSSVIPASTSVIPAQAGIQSKMDPRFHGDDTEAIYQRYLQAFKKGVYNYIKEEQDPITQQMIPRKYFSGGMDFAMASNSRLGGLWGIITWVKSWADFIKIRGESTAGEVVVAVDLKPSVNFKSFVQAQRRLIQRVLLLEENENELKDVLVHAGILDDGSNFDPTKKDQYHHDIITRLAAIGYTEKDLQLIKGQTNADPRLDTAITKQSGNPKGQSIFEAISNSIDALGGDIGQFGMGVKQIIDWLNGPKDRVDVISLTEGGQAHQLQIVKSKEGQEMVQMQAIDLGQFQKEAEHPLVKPGLLTHGTVIKVTQEKPIALDTGVNSLRLMEQSIHERYSLIRGINIYTQVNDEKPQKVNGWEHRSTLVGFDHHNEIKGTVFIKLTPYEIKIIDNGTGMDTEIISRMFVPREGGTKTPESILTEEDVARELKKLELIHDFHEDKVSQGPSVSFVRRGEIIMRVNLNNNIIAQALLDGQIIIDIGRLIDVTQARDKIIFSLNTARGVLDIVERLFNSKANDQEKLMIINSIVAGLEAVAGDNQININIINNIKSKIKSMIASRIERLKSEGHIFLPYAKEFEQLEIAGHDKVIWLNESIFDWQGYPSLERIKDGGARTIDPNRFCLLKAQEDDSQDQDDQNPKSHEQIVVVSMPFKKAVMDKFANVDLRSFDIGSVEGLPLIRANGYVIIPSQFEFEGHRFIDIIQKEALTDQEKLSLAISTQLITTMAGSDVSTSYEIGKVRPVAHVAPEYIPKPKQEGADRIDFEAVNGFLVKPPEGVVPTESKMNLSEVPADAGIKYISKNGKIIDLTTGNEVALPLDRTIKGDLEYVGGNFYYVPFVVSSVTPALPILCSINQGVLKLFIDEKIQFKHIYKPDDFIITPKRNFLYKIGEGRVSIFDLFAGTFFSDTIKEDIIQTQFTEDEKYVYIETQSRILTYNLHFKNYNSDIVKLEGAKYYLSKTYPLVNIKEKDGKKYFFDIKNNESFDGVVFDLAEENLLVSIDGQFSLYDPTSPNIHGVTEDFARNLFLRGSESLEADGFSINFDNLEPGTVYKHPNLDLIIDERGQNSNTAYHTVSGTQFSYQKNEKVFSFFIGEGYSLFDFINEDKLIRKNERGNVLAEWHIVSNDNQENPRCIILKVNDGGGERYELKRSTYARYPFGNNIENRFNQVVFDGKYFVFTDPEAGQVIYLDPEHPDVLKKASVQSLDDANKYYSKIMLDVNDFIRKGKIHQSVQETASLDPKAAQLWTNVLVHREDWIRQAREAYTPLWEMVPEAVRHGLTDHFKSFLSKIYALQEEAVQKQFQEHLARGDTELIFEELPLDIFARRARMIVGIWQKALELEGGFAEQISGLPQSFQVPFFSDFLEHALELLTNPELPLSDMQINADLVQAMTFGWKIRSSRDLKNLDLIVRIIKNARQELGLAVNIQTLQTMIRFLSYASEDSQRAVIVEEQLNLIFSASSKLSDLARNQFVTAWYGSFNDKETADPRRIYTSLSNPEILNSLGRARDYVVYLTHRVKMIPRGHLEDPNGTNWFFVEEQDKRLALDNIAGYNSNKPQSTASGSDLYTIEEIIKNAANVRAVDNHRLRLEIAQYISQQREAGAYTGEIAQNSSDAKAKSLTVRHYFDETLGKYVEEMTDDGDGPPLAKALALIIPKSNKNESQQRGEIAGFFGTGKFTMYAGVDRVEIITNNGEESYVFVLDVDRTQGRVFLSKVGRIPNPSSKPKGVTVRRISDANNVLPELEQMLSMRSWKSFAGMASMGQFQIAFQRLDKLEALEVKGKKILSETDFIVQNPHTGEEINYGKMRLWSVQDADMPIQVIDKKGLRVDDLKLKERFLDLIPKDLRLYIQELRMVIQIPLPLIQNRSSFEREEEFLPQIQKYIAVELYKALVAKRLREENFFLNPVPRDFETNPVDSYNKALFQKSMPHLKLSETKHLFDLVGQISHAGAHTIAFEDIETIKNWFDGIGGTDVQLINARKRAFIAFITQVEVDTNDGHGRNSLLMRRIKTQSKLDEAKARKLAKATGVNYTQATESFDPHVNQRVGLALSIDSGKKSKPKIIDEANMTPTQKAFLETAKKVSSKVGFKNVYLVEYDAPFAGLFTGSSIYLNDSLVSEYGLRHAGKVSTVNKSSETIVHELAHFFETVTDRQLDLKPGADITVKTNIGKEDFTHDGRFISFMRLMSAIALTPTDMAQQAEIHKSFDSKTGGIDFKPDKMNMDIRTDASGTVSDKAFQFNISAGGGSAFGGNPAMFKEFENAPGFEPVIKSISPLQSLQEFIGA